MCPYCGFAYLSMAVEIDASVESQDTSPAALDKLDQRRSGSGHTLRNARGAGPIDCCLARGSEAIRLTSSAPTVPHRAAKGSDRTPKRAKKKRRHPRRVGERAQ